MVMLVVSSQGLVHQKYFTELQIKSMKNELLFSIQYVSILIQTSRCSGVGDIKEITAGTVEFRIDHLVSTKSHNRNKIVMR